MLKTNDTLDTIGLMGSDMYGLRKVFFEVLQKGKDYPFSENYFHFHERYKAKDKSKLKIGVVTDAFNSYQHYDKIVRKDFESVVDQLDKSFRLKKLKGEDYINGIHTLHEHIYSKSLSYYFKNEIQHYHSVSEIMRDMIARGEKIGTDEYVDAIRQQPVLRKKFDKAFQDFDFLITPSTASAAPPLFEQEKNDTCLIWTFLGYPAISIPLFQDPETNLPYGLQIVAKKFDDFSLLDFTGLVESNFTNN